MSTETLSRFFALLSLVSLAAAVFVVAVWILARRSDASAGTRAMLSTIADSALWLGWLVAATTTAGSLYYSLGADFLPCELCWYQRICVYPFSLVLLVAAWRRDRQVWRYVVPVALVGLVISIYHTQLQAFPDQHTFCSLNNPCTTRYVWELGFVSLPFMAMSAFVLIITLALVATQSAKEPSDEQAVEQPSESSEQG
ncbi:MAG: Disulfide bond formation protein DsbB [Ilumatobacteraceae bacterium]|nr:Disulfide bond formation protein DsbB [Ilumatobacteraceae bacterium]